jgi:putative sigma-54 modulation protein
MARDLLYDLARLLIIREVDMKETIEFVIRGATVDTASAIRAYAARKLSAALRRFERSIDSLRVRVTDLNGPRRGVDTSCSITARLVDGRQVIVQATTAVPFASVAQAAAKLREAVARELDRGAFLTR